MLHGMWHDTRLLLWGCVDIALMGHLLMLQYQVLDQGHRSLREGGMLSNRHWQLWEFQSPGENVALLFPHSLIPPPWS